MNNVNLIGRLVRSPELRYLPGAGTAICNFTIAIDRQLSKEKKQEMESQNKPTADFINIITWGKTAEFAANYLDKGLMVGISGRLQSGKYEDKEGRTIYTTDVNCSEITMIDWKDKETENVNQDFYPVENSDIPF